MSPPPAGAASTEGAAGVAGVAGVGAQPKLLIVSTIAATLQAFLLPFARHFRSQGWRVDGLAHGATGYADCRDAFDHVWDAQWGRVPVTRRNFGQLHAVRELVAREGYDIVHVHTPVAAFLTRLALRAPGLPARPVVVYTAHGFHFYEGGQRLPNAIFTRLERLAAPWTDYLVVINREDELAARRLQLAPADRIVRMPGIGVDTRAFAPDAVPDEDVARVRREMGLAASDRLLLMIAEFSPNKCHRNAVAAFARVATTNAHLAFAGDGPLRPRVRALAEQLGVSDRVHFLGLRRDVPALIRAADAVVLPSRREGLPRCALESLSLGVPVIGTRIRGLTDLVDDRSGILVPVGDVAGLAAAMQRLLDDPLYARRLGEGGRARIGTYAVDRVVALHERLYASALAARGGVLVPGSP